MSFSKQEIEEFNAEAVELLDIAERNLMAISQDADIQTAFDSVFRSFHNLKGASGMMELANIQSLMHELENILTRYKGKSSIPKDHIDLFLRGVDAARSLLEGKEITFDYNVPSEAKLAASTTQSQTPVTDEQIRKEADGASLIRVPVNLLDNLMTLMGEMVLVRNQVLQFANKSEDLEFLSMSKRLNAVTSEIQSEMMKTRMQPIGNILSKFNRVIRDLSGELKKNITLTIEGAETELDKSLLELVKDPLTHIVRNSCDHGIELPHMRRNSGKSEQATISIKAYHEGGQVIIEVSDDGKGLQRDAILKKAIEKGLVSQTESSRLSEKEIFDFIFSPGFSTAAQVTNVSGRGVGMDVVRTNIEKIGGTVDLTSVAGSGTWIKIKIPLTLAIIPAILVKCGQGTFAIPQVKLEELVLVDPSDAENKIEHLLGVPVLRLRGNILPLIDLNKVLKKKTVNNYSSGIVNIAVLNAEQTAFGLIIDEVQDTADIVVKPLNRLLKSLQVYSGATILGNGSIALILDVLGIFKLTQLNHEKVREQELSASPEIQQDFSSEAQEYILVRVNSPTKHAIVLNYVQRLEEFKRSQVEVSGAVRILRYRDSILPLVSVNQSLQYEDASVSISESISVVVVKRAGVLYGLEVNQILDTLPSSVEIEFGPVKQPGLIGSLNAKNELIVVIDPFEVIQRAFSTPPHSTQEVKSSDLKIDHQARVLLAEDTVFFRKAIRLVLEKRGYTVVTARDGQEAIDILNSGNDYFDLIISDIEMPRLNGFQLAIAIRKHPKFGKTPLLAVSSRGDDASILQGRNAGFNNYLEKFKPAQLLEVASELIRQDRQNRMVA